MTYRVANMIIVTPITSHREPGPIVIYVIWRRWPYRKIGNINHTILSDIYDSGATGLSIQIIHGASYGNEGPIQRAHAQDDLLCW